MPRWRQTINPETGKSEFIPIGEGHTSGPSGAAIHGPIEPFVSPVDGSIISDRKQLREHNKRNGVVNTHEFGTEHFERKAKERARLYNGEHTPEEKFKRKQEIYEAITRAERNG